MTRTIGGMFGRSMFSPVVEHMTKVLDCHKVLITFIEKFANAEFGALKELSQRIAKLEHDADVIKEEIRLNFSKSILTVVNRSDILGLIKIQDRISDECEDIAKLVSIRKTPLDATLKDTLLALSKKVYEAVVGLCEVEQLIDAGRTDPARIDELLKVISVREWESDQLQLRFMEDLFALEENISPVSLIILKDLCYMIGKIANHAENVSENLRRLIN